MPKILVMLQKAKKLEKSRDYKEAITVLNGIENIFVTGFQAFKNDELCDAIR